MERALACFLLLQVLSAALGKYVYIEEKLKWLDAQKYCRKFHTDLAPVSNAHDMRRLRRLADLGYKYISFGLQRNETDKDRWFWSGGGSVSTFFWAAGEPDNRPGKDYGMIIDRKWHDTSGMYYDPFVCYHVVVVRERMTWEEALEYCREHHRDLASVASETEMLLIQKELEKNVTTEHVWFGLHFFPGLWLWVDGQPLEYKAWGEEGEQSCPTVSLECGALKLKGADNSTGPGPASNGAASHGTAGAAVVNVNTTGSLETNMIEDIKEIRWEAHNCEERHHFICH